MPNALRDSIQHLAAEFATAVLRAIRSASLDDILDGAGGGRVAAARPPLGAPARRGPGRPRKVPLEGAPPSSSLGRPARGRGGRLGRRSAADIADLSGRIVALVAEHADGLRAEQIRKALGLQAKELPRPLAEALDAGAISKSGNKRATTYFAGAGAKGGGKERKSGRAR